MRAHYLTDCLGWCCRPQSLHGDRLCPCHQRSVARSLVPAIHHLPRRDAGHFVRVGLAQPCGSRLRVSGRSVATHVGLRHVQVRWCFPAPHLSTQPSQPYVPVATTPRALNSPRLMCASGGQRWCTLWKEEWKVRWNVGGLPALCVLRSA